MSVAVPSCEYIDGAETSDSETPETPEELVFVTELEVYVPCRNAGLG